MLLFVSNYYKILLNINTLIFLNYFFNDTCLDKITMSVLIFIIMSDVMLKDMTKNK